MRRERFYSYCESNQSISQSNESGRSIDQSNEDHDQSNYQSSDDQSDDQSIESTNRSDDQSTNQSSHNNSLKVWLNPSSSYVRVFLLLTFTSTFITAIHNVFKRLSCNYTDDIPSFILPDPIQVNLLRGLAISLTWTIPTSFISVFVWHFAFDIKADRDSVRRSSEDLHVDHIDFSRFHGLRHLFVDIRHQLMPKKRSDSTHTAGANRSVIADESDDHVHDLTTNASRHCVIHDGTHTIDSRSTEWTSTDGESQLNDNKSVVSAVDVISKNIAQPAIKAGYSIQPLLWLITPQSIYGIILRNQIVDWVASLLFATPWNIDGSCIPSHLGPLPLFLHQIFGTVFNNLITLANTVQLAGEYLFLPLFYRNCLHQLRTSHKLKKKHRSIMWLVIIPLFIIMAQWFDSSNITECFFFYTYFPYFSTWMVTPVFQSYDTRVLVLCALGVMLLIDELGHFSGTEVDDHHQCPCRVWYLMMLVVLISQSAGFVSIMFSTWHWLEAHAIDLAMMSLRQQIMFHMLLISWQVIVSQVALRALPATSSDAVLFPVQLLDDVVGWSYFFSSPLFSTSFFLSLGVQLCKPVVRDLNCAPRLFEACHRAMRRCSGRAVTLVSRETARRKWRSRHLMRYQSFMAEICGKCIMITVFVVDVLPLYSYSPVLFSPAMGSNGDCDIWRSVQYNLRCVAVLIGLSLVHIVTHVLLLKVIDRMDGSEVHDVMGQSKSISNDQRGSLAVCHVSHQQLFDSHWSRHYLFWLVCVLKLTAITLENTQFPFNTYIPDNCYPVWICAQSQFGVQGSSPFINARPRGQPAFSSWIPQIPD